MSGTVVAVELVLLAGLLQRGLDLIHLLRRWKLVVVAKDAQQRDSHLRRQVNWGNRMGLTGWPAWTRRDGAAPAVNCCVDGLHLAGRQIRQTPARAKANAPDP